TVVCGVTIVKQKRQASAAFLGVRAVSTNVLRACCILTTILGVLVPPDSRWKWKKQQLATWRGMLFANQHHRENADPVTSDSPHEKGRSGTLRPLRNVVPSKTTRQLWSPPLDEPDPHDGADGSGVAQLGAGAGSGSGAAIAGSALGAAGLAAAFLFFAGLFFAAFFVAAIDFLAAFLADFFAPFLAAFFADFFVAFFAAFLADFFFATTAFLAFLAFLPFLLFFAFAIWSSCF